MKKKLIFNSFPALVTIISISGCAGYAGKVQKMRTALSEGNKKAAINHIDNALKVKNDSDYPDKLNSVDALLVTERATVKQAMDKFKESSIDFRVADQKMELIDITRDTVGNISKWIFSGSSGVYRAPPHEKMLLSTLNMLNYLAKGNLEDARVEARRLDITEQYLSDSSRDSNQKIMLGIGDYLSGFTFEMSRKYEQALQQYNEALQSQDYTSLKKVIPAVAGCTTYRNDEINTYLAKHPATTDKNGMTICTANKNKTGTLLVIASSGMAPNKIAKRIPIGAAIVLAGAFLTPMQISQANGFAVKGMLKWVNFPRLVQASPQFSTVSVSVDNSPVNIELGQNISKVVKNSWDKIKGKLIAAAIVRMITRAIAGEGANAAGSSGGNSGLGLLTQVLVEGAMTIADTPDTRTWNTLPASFFISRVTLPPGKHKVLINFSGKGNNINVVKEVTIVPGGFAVLPVHTMR